MLFAEVQMTQKCLKLQCLKDELVFTAIFPFQRDQIFPILIIMLENKSANQFVDQETAENTNTSFWKFFAEGDETWQCTNSIIALKWLTFDVEFQIAKGS